MKCLVFTFLISSLFLSCLEPQRSGRVYMEPTPILEGTINWGVVKVPYLRVSRDPASPDKIIGVLRKGDLVRVEASHYADTEWEGSNQLFHVRAVSIEGWVGKKFIEGYSSQEKAQTASRLYGEGRSPDSVH